MSKKTVCLFSCFQRPSRRTRRKTIDYKSLNNGLLLELGKRKNIKPVDTTIYPVEVKQTKFEAGKLYELIHYIDYDSQFDEWRESSDVIRLNTFVPDILATDNVRRLIQHDLRIISMKIKGHLKTSAGKSHIVRDSVIISCETKKYLDQFCVHGTVQIAEFSVLFGPDWNKSILNVFGDYCEVSNFVMRIHDGQIRKAFEMIQEQIVETKVMGEAHASFTFLRLDRKLKN